MGLDMYFTAAKASFGGYEHNKGTREAETFDAIIAASGFPREVVQASVEVRAQVGYLRKANAIHAWLVKHIQGGVDDCRTAYFSPEKIAELRDTVRQILDTVVKGEPSNEHGYETYPDLTVDAELAAELLPPQEGFFFGSYEIDEWYVSDLEVADTFLTIMLEHEGVKDCDFYYHSSW